MADMHFDVLIVGGGMVGASCACAFGDSGLRIGVLDSRVPAQHPADDTGDYDPRVSALTLASRNLFDNLGVWDHIRRGRFAPVEAMQIWEGESEIHFDAADIGEPCLAYIVENSLIQLALVERLRSFSNVQTLWPVQIRTIAIDAAETTVTLEDGRRLHARLLVGADGADSAVRRAAGIESRQIDMKQHGIVATVRTELPHRQVAYQRFLNTGPLAFLPLSALDACSIVWSADTARAQALMAFNDTMFQAELQAAFGERLGRIVSISRRQAFALTLAHARRYTAPRLALIGDAAHSVHPLAGQGANLGLLDAATLVQTVLAGSAHSRDIGAHDSLRRYERARKSDNLGMIAATGGFKYLFGNDRPFTRTLRRAGLRLVDAATPMKRRIMRRAAGLDGELPALARAPGSMK